mmetsp:Transcript_54817/g.81591  ORF Transcript_54817/g.81591 Transcript_54817/m.81591 type:complete len:96 (-) Transcript_54817:8-295(-)
MRDNGIQYDGIYGRSDPKVVINLLAGLYVVRSNNIMDYYNEDMDLLENSGACEWHTCKHASRSDNSRADKLANNAIDDNVYRRNLPCTKCVNVHF